MVKDKILNKLIKPDWIWTVLTILFLLSPLIAALLISLESGTSVFRYDAWNTTWNDESSYNIVVREIREYILPQNVRSYNEVEPIRLGYGTYRPTTYIPYVFASFFTGITSHNYFVYCNLVLITLANIFFLWAVRPSRGQLIWLTLSMSVLLPYQRYAWSGMTEASHVSMVIVMIGCGVCLFNDKNTASLIKERIVLSVSVIMPLLYGTIRGYQFIFLLIPLAYVLTHRNGIRRVLSVVGIIAMLAAGLYIYVCVLPKYCSPYSYYSSGRSLGSTSQFKQYMADFANGDIAAFISDMIEKNMDAHNQIVEMMRVKSWHWIAVAEPVFIFLLLAIVGILDRNMRERKVIIATFIISSIFVMEGVIMMNKVAYVSRYYLGIWVGGIYLLCSVSDIRRSRIACAINFLATVICMYLIVFNYGSKFAFPQISEIYYDDKNLSQVFEEIMPRDTEDPWNNTIASGGNIRYLRYLYPSYISNSACETSVLIDLIEQNTLKSKYISVTDDKVELIDLCESKYELIFCDYGLRLYKVR